MSDSQPQPASQQQLSNPNDQSLPPNADSCKTSTHRKFKNNKKGCTQKQNKPDSPKFRKAEERMNGHVFQCAGEPGRKPNQFKKTTSEIKDYVNKTFDSPLLFETIIIDLKEPDVIEPSEPGAEATRVVIHKWELRMKQHARDEVALKKGKFALWSLVWGQCSNLTRTKFKPNADFFTKDKEKNCVWLLEKINSVVNKVEQTKHPALTIIESRKRSCNYKQGREQDLLDYAKQI